jgi:hypothetical protein
VSHTSPTQSATADESTSSLSGHGPSMRLSSARSYAADANASAMRAS